MTAPRPVPKRLTPRISLLALAEYLTAGPARRRRIIEEQRQPPTYQVIRYDEAIRPMRRALVAGPDGPAVLRAARAQLLGRPVGSAYDQQNRDLCVLALDAAVTHWGVYTFGGFLPQLGDPKPPKLPVATVGVSVRPDLLLRGPDPDGPLLGAIKFRFSRRAPLSQKAGEYAANTLQWYLEDQLAPPGTRVDRARCVVIDVFHGAVIPAPKAIKQRRADIRAACAEIARGWTDE